MTAKTMKTSLYLIRFVMVIFKPKLEKPYFELSFSEAKVRGLALVERKDGDPVIIVEARTELAEG